jgi:hypothetical protein
MYDTQFAVVMANSLTVSGRLSSTIVRDEQPVRPNSLYFCPSHPPCCRPPAPWSRRPRTVIQCTVAYTRYEGILHRRHLLRPNTPLAPGYTSATSIAPPHPHLCRHPPGNPYLCHRCLRPLMSIAADCVFASLLATPHFYRYCLRPRTRKNGQQEDTR